MDEKSDFSGYGTDADTPSVLLPNVVGGLLNRCHLPPGHTREEYRVSFGIQEDVYRWNSSARAWIVGE